MNRFLEHQPLSRSDELHLNPVSAVFQDLAVTEFIVSNPTINFKIHSSILAVLGGKGWKIGYLGPESADYKQLSVETALQESTEA